MGATHVEKATVQGGELNSVPTEIPAEAQYRLSNGGKDSPSVCSIYDPECEACQ